MNYNVNEYMTRGFKEMVNISDGLIANKKVQMRKRLVEKRQNESRRLPSCSEFGAQTCPTQDDVVAPIIQPRYMDDGSGFTQIKHRSKNKQEVQVTGFDKSSFIS